MNTIPTEEELEKIPNKNWINWLKNEYNIVCSEPHYFLIGEEAENGFLQFKTFCTSLNQTFCDVTPEVFEKIKIGYYNKRVKNRRGEFIKIIKFMGYEKAYPDNNSYFRKENNPSIFLDESEIAFRPDINWKNLNAVIDYIESLDYVKETNLSLVKMEKNYYKFEILLRDISMGPKSGVSENKKIEAAYDGVLNFIKWANKKIIKP